MLEGWEWIDVSFEYSLRQSRGCSRGERAVTYFLLRSCVAIQDFFSGVFCLAGLLNWNISRGLLDGVFFLCASDCLLCRRNSSLRLFCLPSVSCVESSCLMWTADFWDLVRCGASWGWTIVDGPSLEPLVVVFFSFLFWILSREFYLFFFILFFWHLMDWDRLR